MSAYTTRLCLEHGEWDDDVDNPSDCPDCIKEGKTEVQRLNAEIAALREAVRRLWPGDLTPPFSDQRIALQLRMIRVPESSVPIIRRALEEKP